MNSTAGVQFRLVPRSELTLGQKSGMFQLLSRHFAGVTPEQFARDLAEKNLALLLEREETFVGFSTLLAYTTAFEGEMLNVIYSGGPRRGGPRWRWHCHAHGLRVWTICAERFRPRDVSGCCSRRDFERTGFCRCSGASFFRDPMRRRLLKCNVCWTSWHWNVSARSSIHTLESCVSRIRNVCAPACRTSRMAAKMIRT